ncbi:MAG: RNA-binding S4 domain-containing protein [Rhodoferax sp.]|nr:RNA-binding S4 domain-containing protein [Rhodoferax sp.]
MRIDKWLWAARFYKTRSLAAQELDKGRVQLNGHAVKPAHEIKPGDKLMLRQGTVLREVQVLGLSMQRGPAPVAQALYEESADSVTKRLLAAEHRKLNSEPAASIEHGRPTKRDRRSIDKGWDSRWGASIDAGDSNGT